VTKEVRVHKDLPVQWEPEVLRVQLAVKVHGEQKEMLDLGELKVNLVMWERRDQEVFLAKQEVVVLLASLVVQGDLVPRDPRDSEDHLDRKVSRALLDRLAHLDLRVSPASRE